MRNLTKEVRDLCRLNVKIGFKVFKDYLNKQRQIMIMDGTTNISVLPQLILESILFQSFRQQRFLSSLLSYSKIYVEFQRFKNIQKSFTKEDKLALLDIKTYDKTMVMKEVLQWYWDRQIETEFPNIYMHIYKFDICQRSCYR